ncbi:MAG: PPOX class F420-dependent oxidoreductase [Chloroflexi bacterium]|nr:PPOX class F420-dependent oxidoreductase [Chloroflexota bacterium]
MQIPDQYKDLLNSKALAHVATIMPDGSPQVTPVWFSYDGEYICINSAAGRVKDRNMRRDARVAVSITDPKDPYRHFEVRGRVAIITTEGAAEHIDQLARQYTGADKYQGWRPDMQRVIYKISIDKVTING